MKTPAARKSDPRKHCVMIYTRYERFWHWSQALLIFILAFSGFGVHGTHHFLDFRTAVVVHSTAAVALIVLWIFTTFWNFTTGQWKQYLPELSRLPAIIKFYAWGILTGAPHPYHKTLRRKQNALQSLAYLWFMVFIGPALWASGIVYLAYPLWAEYAIGTPALPAIATIHLVAAFLMIVFVAIHVYMTTTGKTLTHYIRTMITGYDRIELEDYEAAYLAENEPSRIED